MIPDGMLWNEAQLELGDPINEGFLTLLVITGDDVKIIGTAFIVQTDKLSALAITAAHNFEGIRQVCNPQSTRGLKRSHALSALPEFLPPPENVDLTNVKAAYTKKGQAYLCGLEVAVWDNTRDFAVLKVIPPLSEPDLFEQYFLIDNHIPYVGEVVAMIGFSEMKDSKIVKVGITEGWKFSVPRKLCVRIGKVETIYDRTPLVKTQCLQTSIPIFFGMSGGLVARYTAGQEQIKPFAFISHAPDLGLNLNDRSLSGQSIAAVLDVSVDVDTSTGLRNLSFPFVDAGVGHSRK